MAKTVDKIVTIVNGMGKSEPTPVKAKPAEKKEVKKPAAKKTVAKKAVTKKEIKEKPVEKKTATKKETKEKPAVKKSEGVTAIDTVLAIIKEAENGINTADLMAKTGFNAKKVQNIIGKLKKKGQIKTVSRGVFGIA